jgi:hypothetical protein
MRNVSRRSCILSGLNSTASANCQDVGSASNPRLGNGLLLVVAGEKKMPLINIVITLIVVGVALWLINTYIPMAGSIKTILNAVVVVAVCIWVLQAFGLWEHITSYKFTK